MWSIRMLGAAFCVWALSAGCGDEGGDDDGPGNGTGGTGGSSAQLPPGVQVVGSGVTPPAGECMSSADCVGGAGMGCGQMPSGYKVCTFQTAQATMPSSNPTLDECDASADCAAGACFNVPVFPNGICGTGAPRSYNVCRDNGCTSDADCSDGGVCGPAGFSADEKYGGGLIRQCIPAACRSNGDCTKAANGICAVVQAGCDLATTGGAQQYLPAQLACVYPNGCTSLSDCRGTPGAVCKVIRGEGVCVVQS